MAGDVETGVTVIKLVEELDAGPIAAQQAFPVGEDAGPSTTVPRRSAPSSSSRCCRIRPSRLSPTTGVTYADKVARRPTRSTSPIRKRRSNRVRALSPHIGARTELHGRPVTIWRARLEDGAFVPVEVQPAGGSPDELTRPASGRLHLDRDEGAVLEASLQTVTGGRGARYGRRCGARARAPGRPPLSDRRGRARGRRGRSSPRRSRRRRAGA